MRIFDLEARKGGLINLPGINMKKGDTKMKAIHYKEILPIVFENDQAKNLAGRLLIGQADGAKNFCMRIFEVGPEGHTPRHSHDWEHEIFIHEGKGEVLLKDEWKPISKGTAIFIPPNVEHQIKNTSDKPLFVICLIPSGAPEI